MNQALTDKTVVFSYHARWDDMDFNAHMANTSYLSIAADTRMRYFASKGFPVSEFARLQVGPVVFKDEIDYFHEVHLLEDFSVSLAIDGLSPNGSRFQLCNEIFRADGKLAARVRSTISWLNLAKRHLTIPPKALYEALAALPKTSNYQDLPDSKSAV